MTTTAPPPAWGQIRAAICAALGYKETIRLRRQIEAVIRLREVHEGRLAAVPASPRSQARSRAVVEAYDELSAATDLLLERLGQAGFLA